MDGVNWTRVKGRQLYQINESLQIMHEDLLLSTQENVDKIHFTNNVPLQANSDIFNYI